jgi:hypothetical protein
MIFISYVKVYIFWGKEKLGMSLFTLHKQWLQLFKECFNKKNYSLDSKYVYQCIENNIILKQLHL